MNNTLTIEMIKDKHLIDLWNLINEGPIEDLNLSEGHVYEAYWQTVFILQKNNHHLYEVCEGILEKDNLSIISNIKTYLTDTKINQSNSDGIADIKLCNKKTGEYVFMSAKYHKTEKSMSQLDISNIKIAAEHAKIQDYVIWVLVKDKEKLKNTKRAEYIHTHVKNSLDENDLRKELQILKNIWKPIDEYLDELTESFMMVPYFHQELTKNSIMYQIIIGEKEFIIAWKCRLGKTIGLVYITHHLRIHYGQNINILVVLLNPTETKDDFVEEFNKLQKHFNIIEVDSLTSLERVEDDRSNVIIISKQKLCHKNNMSEDEETIMTKLKSITFHGIFFDERHNGGTTEKTSDFISQLTNVGITINTTYTYDKCVYNNDIKPENIFEFSQEHIIKATNLETNINYFETRYGTDIVHQSLDNLKKDGQETTDIENIYKKFPKLNLYLINIKDEANIRDQLEDMESSKGFNISSLFERENDGWKYDKGLKAITQRLFGSPDLKYEGKDYLSKIKKENVIMKTRTLNPNVSDDPTVILMYLSTHNTNCDIHKLGKEYQKLLESLGDIGDDFIITKVTSQDKITNLNSHINKYTEKAKKAKKNLIILCGKMLSLAVTIKLCDIIIMADNSMSLDLYKQRLERASNPNDNKKNSYVIDLNTNRSLRLLMEDNVKRAKSSNIKDTLKMISESDIITIRFNGYDLNTLEEDEFNELTDKITEEYIDYEKSFDHGKNYINDKWTRNVFNSFDEESKKSLRNISNGKFISSTVKLGGSKINTGSQKVASENVPNSDSDNETNSSSESDTDLSDQEDKPESTKLDLRNLKILMNNLFKVLYFKVSVRKFIVEDIYNIEGIYQLVLQNCEGSLLKHLDKWFEKVDDETKYEMISKLVKALKNNIESYTIKELMADLKIILNDPRKLTEWCSENLVSSDMNRMDNGEVFTPLWLIGDMFKPYESGKLGLNTEIHKDMKFLDLCGGPGNGACYMYHMIFNNRKMKELIPDEDDRQDHIMNHMIHISEKDESNIEILKDLGFKNIYEGDAIGRYPSKWVKDENGVNQEVIQGFKTLKNPKEFTLYQTLSEINMRFDMIYMNPPYQKPNTKNPGKFNGGSFYPYFIRLAIEILKENGLLFTIHPPGWKKFTNDKSNGCRIKWILQENTLLYLNSSDKEDKFEGKTRKAVDYYILQKKINTNQTETLIHSEYNNLTYDGRIYIPPTTEIIPKYINKTSFNLLEKLTNDNNSHKVRVRRDGPGNDIKSDKLNHKVVGEKLVYVNEPNQEYPYKILGQYNVKGPSYNYSSNDSPVRTKPKIIFGCKINISDLEKSIVIDEAGEIIPSFNTHYILKDDVSFSLEYLKLLMSSNLFKFILRMTCFSRTQDHKDQIEYNYLNTLYLPNEELIDNQNINQSLYEFYNFTKNEILLVNNVLNDKKEILNSMSHVNLKQNFDKKGLKAVIIDEIIKESTTIKLDFSNESSSMMIAENINYHIYDNVYLDNDNNNISSVNVIKYDLI
jgi:hypothetical protein